MTLHFKRKARNISLLQAIFWSVIGTIFMVDALVDKEGLRFFDYGFVLIGLGHLAEYLLVKRKGYLYIDNQSITRSGVPKRSMKIQEISNYKYYAGDYTLYDSKSKLKIDSYAFDADAKEQFVQLLKEWDIPEQ